MAFGEPAAVSTRPSPSAATNNHRVPASAVAVAEAVQEAAVRGTLAIGLAAIAVIHAVDSVGKWAETRYIFWLYMALVAASVVLAAGVLFSRSRVAVAAAAGLAGTVLAGFIVNRAVGLPGAMADIGNWTEPLGLASMVVEGLVVAVGIAGLRTAGAAARLVPER